jgi:hypothetical protein
VSEREEAFTVAAGQERQRAAPVGGRRARGGGGAVGGLRRGDAKVGEQEGKGRRKREGDEFAAASVINIVGAADVDGDVVG